MFHKLSKKEYSMQTKCLVKTRTFDQASSLLIIMVINPKCKHPPPKNGQQSAPAPLTLRFLGPGHRFGLKRQRFPRSAAVLGESAIQHGDGTILTCNRNDTML